MNQEFGILDCNGSNTSSQQLTDSEDDNSLQSLLDFVDYIDNDKREIINFSPTNTGESSSRETFEDEQRSSENYSSDVTNEHILITNMPNIPSNNSMFNSSSFEEQDFQLESLEIMGSNVSSTFIPFEQLSSSFTETHNQSPLENEGISERSPLSSEEERKKKNSEAAKRARLKKKRKIEEQTKVLKGLKKQNIELNALKKDKQKEKMKYHHELKKIIENLKDTLNDKNKTEEKKIEAGKKLSDLYNELEKLKILEDEKSQTVQTV